MNTLLVYVELDVIGKLLSSIFTSYLNGFGTRVKLNEEVYILKTSKSSTVIRDEIRNLFPNKNCQVLVLDITGDAWASSNLSTEFNNWFRNNI